jgi:hypothetical protein
MTRLLTSMCVITVLVGAGASEADASLRFRGAAHFDVPLERELLAVADINHDDLSDVVVGTTDWAPETRLMLARGRGRLSPSRSLYVGRPEWTRAGGVGFGDLNGDGERDIVRVLVDTDRLNGRDPTTLVMMFGDGRGRFPTTALRRARCCGWDVVVADFNRDRHDDLAVRDAGVFLGDGTGLFPRLLSDEIGASPLRPTESFVAADLNVDRRLDLVVLNGDEDPDPAHVQLGLGRGRFDEPEVLDAGDIGSVAVGRFDRDRWPDLAAITDGGLRVLLGTRSGIPRPVKRMYLASVSLSEVEVADIDGDRKTDLVVTAYAEDSSFRGNVQVLRGTGRGTFLRPVQVAHCCFGPAIEIGHFNRDRRPDVIVESALFAPDGYSIAANRVAVLINETTRRR